MAKKTAVRALVKYLPKSTETGQAIASDEQKVTHLRGVDEVQIQPVDDVVDAEEVTEA